MAHLSILAVAASQGPRVLDPTYRQRESIDRLPSGPTGSFVHFPVAASSEVQDETGKLQRVVAHAKEKVTLRSRSEDTSLFVRVWVIG